MIGLNGQLSVMRSVVYAAILLLADAFVAPRVYLKLLRTKESILSTDKGLNTLHAQLSVTFVRLNQ